VVVLDLIVLPGPGEDHLGTAAEAREVMVAHGAHGDEKVGIRQVPRKTQRSPVRQRARGPQRRLVAAVVLDHGHAPGKFPDQVGDLVLGRRWMGTAGDEDGDAVVRYAFAESIEDGRQCPRQVDGTGGVRHHHRGRGASAGHLTQGLRVPRRVQSSRHRPAGIRHGPTARGPERPHPEPAEIDGHPVVRERQSTDHVPALRTVS
jgi:hypothetical protein